MLSGLILAGGRSARMGRDKAGLTLPDGRTLLERQADILRAAGATKVFASVRPENKVALPGIGLVHDAMADAGPLAGILAGLQAAPPGLVLVLAVDMPKVQAAHLRALIEMAAPDRGVVPVLDGRIEPLAALYPTALAASAKAALAGEDRAVHAWAQAATDRGSLLLWEVPDDWVGVLRSWNTEADIPR